MDITGFARLGRYYMHLFSFAAMAINIGLSKNEVDQCDG